MSAPTSPLRAAAIGAMRHNGFVAEFPDAVIREVGHIADRGAMPLATGTMDLRALA